MIVHRCEQGSEAWQQLRCGVVTMSHAKELLTVGKGKTRQSYIIDVISERLSGKPVESYSSIDMQRGQFLEPYALMAFEQTNGINIERVGFITTDDGRIGCSPDGLIGEDAGIEVKCPNPRQHLRNILSDGLSDYTAQVQGNIWITGRDQWFIVSFCPWVECYPIYCSVVTRDEIMIASLSESALNAVEEIDDAIRNVSIYTPTRTIHDIANEARKAWESTFAINDEVQL